MRIKTKNIIGITIVLVLMLVILITSSKTSLFPIETIIIKGDYWRISQAKLKTIIKPGISGSFFAVKLDRLRESLLKQLPWASTITVSKQWPGIITIVVQQKQAVANWNSVALMENNSELFYPLSTTFPKGLPVFEARKSERAKLLENYKKMLQEIMSNDSLVITKIKITSQGNWLVSFNHKTVVMLGDTDILAKFRRFVAIYKQVFEKEQRIPVYVDMRYSHGLAIKWH